MIKKLGITFLLITTLCVIFNVGRVKAHVLKVDGQIATVLHINPDDDPIAATPTMYLLYYSDYTNHFKLPKCICLVKIIENGNTLTTQPVQQAEDLEGYQTFTFPKADVYTLQVTGRPKQTGGFQSFSINFLVRVTGTGSVAQPFPPILVVGLVLVNGLILLGAYASSLRYST